MSSAVTAALAALHQRIQQHDTALWAEYDAEWPSACERGEPQQRNGETMVRWHPIARMDGGNDFAGLENALETSVHPDFKAYFCSYWSGTLETAAPEGHVSLLQLWNPADVERLIENLLGHVLEQRRARGPLSLFFACTEPDSDLILSLDNDSGAVLLEQPGRLPLRTVAPSLAAFLPTLVPAPPPAAA